MATREERMRQRLRGAVRHQVEDISFGPLLPIGGDIQPTTDTGVRPSPALSAKRRLSHPTRQLPEDRPETSVRRKIRNSGFQGSDNQTGDVQDDIETLPSPAPRRTSRRVSTARHEEIEESPVDAPGSGQRREVTGKEATSSSRRLHQLLSAVDEDGEPTEPASSPLARKTRRSTVGSVRSTKGTTRSTDSRIDEVDELSPVAERSRREPSGLKGVLVNPPASEDELDAHEIDDVEAARYLGRKRPRQSMQEPSPELDSFIEEPIADQSVEGETEEPSRKRRRRRAPDDTQKQRPRPRKTQASQATQSQTNKKTKRSEPLGDETIPITVQRFTKKPVANEQDPDADILALDIPFASRSGVNTIDVLSQICEEIIDTTVEQLNGEMEQADSASLRKDLRIKTRALDAFQEELRTRLLQHTIMLDSLHTLGKQVRKAQKDKLSLREEILRLRSEREQVALRMDAAREKHETNSKEMLQRLDMSASMHEIDLALERGRAASELPRTAQKAGHLANLELLITGLSEQACSREKSGGILKGIRAFNGFLERAAVALEAR